MPVPISPVILLSSTGLSNKFLILQEKVMTNWPTTGWQTSTPEEQGVDSKLLEKVFDFVEENDLNLHSLLVIRHGNAVLDASFFPYTPNTLHDLASCTKSFTSTLVGIAIDKGYIKSVKQPVLDLLKGREVANVDTRKKAMTLEHLLTMSSGLACYAEPGEITLREMFQSADWVKFTLDLPMIEAPGTRFEYCSPASYLLSAIVQETTGMATLDFARLHLFEPLGISEIIWPVSPQGINHGWGDLHLLPHDMAKLGYLFLNNGQWDGKEIISPDWVAKATSKHATPPEIFGYGYQWWLAAPGIYTAIGRGGQTIITVPELDMVLVTTGGLQTEDVNKLFEELTTFILTAGESTAPLPPNLDGVALLESRIRQASIPEAKPEPVPVLPQIAQRISGIAYEVEAAMPPFYTFAFSLTFSQAEESQLNLHAGDQTLRLNVGLDNVLRINPNGRFDLPVALKGRWETDTVFTLHVNEIANINNWQIQMTFENDEVTIETDEATWHSPVTVKGRSKQ